MHTLKRSIAKGFLAIPLWRVTGVHLLLFSCDLESADITEYNNVGIHPVVLAAADWGGQSGLRSELSVGIWLLRTGGGQLHIKPMQQPGGEYVPYVYYFFRSPNFSFKLFVMQHFTLYFGSRGCCFVNLQTSHTAQSEAGKIEWKFRVFVRL